MKNLISLVTITAITILTTGYPASAGWYVGGVFVSNMCRAPSGAWWLYPPIDAQPVGTFCTILGTGEGGVVTPN
jgi:hypothetical protein